MPRVFEHGTIKKRLFFALFLRRNLSCATAIHCTGESEQEAVRELGVTCGRTFVAPLGAYLPELEESEKSIKRRHILFLSRLGEEKGLKLLLEAWDSIEHNSWHLIIAGPDWKNYRKQLEEMISRRKIQDVSLPGLVIGSAKDKIYREADIFILPSPMENFSMVVLDALAYGLPVICTQGTPWGSVSDAKCGWWISANSVKALIDALKEAMSLDDDVYRQMSLRARRLAARYSWDEVLKVVFREYKTAMQEKWRSKEHV